MFQRQPISDIRYYCPRGHTRAPAGRLPLCRYTHASSKQLSGEPFRHTFRCPQYTLAPSMASFTQVLAVDSHPWWEWP